MKLGTNIHHALLRCSRSWGGVKGQGHTVVALLHLVKSILPKPLNGLKPTHAQIHSVLGFLNSIDHELLKEFELQLQF